MNIVTTNNISFVSRGLRIVYLIILGNGYPISFLCLFGMKGTYGYNLGVNV
jgi:hypothetical protein